MAGKDAQGGAGRVRNAGVEGNGRMGDRPAGSSNNHTTSHRTSGCKGQREAKECSLAFAILSYSSRVKITINRLAPTERRTVQYTSWLSLPNHRGQGRLTDPLSLFGRPSPGEQESH